MPTSRKGIFAGLTDFYCRWRKDRRDRADLVVMSDIELQDIGRPTFSAWQAAAGHRSKRAD